MTIFGKLHALRAQQREHMPYLKSLEDLDLVCAIGCAQERGNPVSPSALLAMGLGATATVRRRLTRLINQDIVVRRADAGDGRRIKVQLSAKAFKSYARLGPLC